MASITSFKEANGATPTNTTVTSIRFCTSDTHNPGTNYKLTKPSSGVNRSYWKTIYLNADTTPAGTINNIKFYTDGSIGWSGATLYVGTTTTYTQATGTQDESGDDSTVATTDAETYTQASPLSVGGSISNPDTGKISDYIVLQVDIDNTVNTGAFPAETLTIQFDED